MADKAYMGRLKMISSCDIRESLRGQLIGLEKEFLRADHNGQISQKVHPAGLGSALTHPKITTDFSESLLELVTPPMAGVPEVMDELLSLHQYVYRHIGDELFWSTSMPCLLEGEESIRIARYGESNIGFMKTVYRRGLAARYGKMMQAIAGVHFNFSFPLSFWEKYHSMSEPTQPLQEFINASYFSMLRNLQRIGWLIPYLFGASPAICKSFLQGQPTHLSDMGAGTYYDPYGTSLRMGDIGYQNSQEGKTGVKVCYDSLNSYTRVLNEAINTPCANYEKIGVKVNGEYRQLNANQLQIENEYYASVRPKAVPGTLEKPVDAMHRLGVQYLELRSIDLNIFEPLGVSESQLYFVQALMLHSLMMDNTPIRCSETYDIDANLLAVAHHGRDPGLMLTRNEKPVAFSKWALQELNDMQGVCELLDKLYDKKVYTDSLKVQKEKVKKPEQTPSAKMISLLKDNKQSFFSLAKQYSETHREWITSQPENEQKMKALDVMKAKSIFDQQVIEDAEDQSFDDFLKDYFEK